MKKFLTWLLAGVLAVIALANLGHIVGLLIGAAIMYWSMKSFFKAESLLGKFGYGLIGLIGLAIVFGNFPAIIGIAALTLLYYGYRCWKKENMYKTKENGYTSYSSFEEEWEKVMKNY